MFISEFKFKILFEILQKVLLPKGKDQFENS